MLITTLGNDIVLLTNKIRDTHPTEETMKAVCARQTLVAPRVQLIGENNHWWWVATMFGLEFWCKERRPST
jgi:hypothetical protein